MTDGGSGVAASSRVPQSVGINLVSSMFIVFLASRCLARSKLFDDYFPGKGWSAASQGRRVVVRYLVKVPNPNLMSGNQNNSQDERCH